MYDTKIKFEKLVRGIWVNQFLRTTSDAVWFHLRQMELSNDIRNVVVVNENV